MDIVNIFLNKNTYGHEAAEKIVHISTATADVFLTGDFAYKICKPVDYGFLNFSTLDRRKVQLNNEMVQNILFSPKMYKGISKLIFRDGGYFLVDVEGEGEAIEYAMKMEQMNPKHVAGEILKGRDLSDEEIKSLALELANFHKIAPTDTEIEKYGGIKYIRLNWDENFEQTKGHRGSLIGEEDFDFIKSKVESFIASNYGRFKERVESGRVRQCHGDCHLDNVFLIDSKAMFFDSLTFNKRFPCSDVASEVAFMYMDLIAKDKKDSADKFLSEYLDTTKDFDIMGLINFYSCYRAYIRAKIATFSLDNKGEEERAREYFKLALYFANMLTEE